MRAEVSCIYSWARQRGEGATCSHFFILSAKWDILSLYGLWLWPVKPFSCATREVCYISAFKHSQGARCMCVCTCSCSVALPLLLAHPSGWHWEDRCGVPRNQCVHPPGLCLPGRQAWWVTIPPTPYNAKQKISSVWSPCRSIKGGPKSIPPGRAQIVKSLIFCLIKITPFLRKLWAS